MFDTSSARVLQLLGGESSDDAGGAVDSSSYASSNEDEDSEFDPNNVDRYDDVDEYNGERFYSSRPKRPPRDAVEFVKEAMWVADAGQIV